MKCVQPHCRADQNNKKARTCWKCGFELPRKNDKRRPKPQQAAKPIRSETYTHRTADGMSWRFVGLRPVSALADSVMGDKKNWETK